jgi:hypothetical membrane protein
MRSHTGWQKWGALCFSLGGLQYLLAEKLSALSWVNPRYSYSQNYISDLGIPFRSPLHNLMNSGFAIEGVLFFIACWLLRHNFNGIGRVVFIGETTGLTLHQVGAVMAIAGGNLCLITVGCVMCFNAGFRRYGALSLILGCLGLLCMVTITYNIFPIGIIERASVYPITLWQILTGLGLLINSRRA